MHRNARVEQRQRQQQVKHAVASTDSVSFFNLLTSPQLLEVTEAQLPEHRERLYPPTVTLSMFMMQALNADSSCQHAVNGWSAQRLQDGLSAPGVSTGAYCKARERLPQAMVSALVRHSGECVSALAPKAWGWRGRSVKLLDGTTVSMPDSAANQARYPQSSRQTVGVGFPLARMAAVICLSTGAVCDAAMGSYKGKGGSELALLRQLYQAFRPGDIALGDALYCNYFLIVALQQRGVDVLFEQQGGRITDFRRGERLGQRDHRVYWPRPRRPQWMTQAQYDALPPHLALRETQVAGRVLVTTLLEHRQVAKPALSALYQRRWQVELDLRNIKVTLGMDILHCRTPAMNEKQLWVTLLAYNLIRLLMAQAALQTNRQPRQLSFKHTLQLWTCWVVRGLLDDPSHTDCLFRYIASRTVGNRAGRVEPRVRKRRPKAFPLLKIPRAHARAQLRATQRYAA